MCILSGEKKHILCDNPDAWQYEQYAPQPILENLRLDIAERLSMVSNRPMLCDLVKDLRSRYFFELHLLSKSKINKFL